MNTASNIRTRIDRLIAENQEIIKASSMRSIIVSRTHRQILMLAIEQRIEWISAKIDDFNPAYGTDLGYWQDQLKDALIAKAAVDAAA
ncbi:MAG: hypothetical protein V4563_15020 [Pseudomonadota bacterium]